MNFKPEYSSLDRSLFSNETESDVRENPPASLSSKPQSLDEQTNGQFKSEATDLSEALKSLQTINDSFIQNTSSLWP